MKDAYPKYIVNSVVIVLVVIIIAITFTMNSPISDKKDCYKKVYKKEMNENPQVREWDKINKGFKTRIRPKVEMEGEAAKVAAILCYGTYNK
jgi:hypothetical protein